MLTYDSERFRSVRMDKNLLARGRAAGDLHRRAGVFVCYLVQSVALSPVDEESRAGVEVSCCCGKRVLTDPGAEATESVWQETVEQPRKELLIYCR